MAAGFTEVQTGLRGYFNVLAARKRLRTRNYRPGAEMPPWSLPRRERPDDEESADRWETERERRLGGGEVDEADEDGEGARKVEPREGESPVEEGNMLGEVPEPGPRPIRTEEVCYPLPGDDLYPTVSEFSATIPGEVWLYASGGGLRSPQASLGAAWYLEHIDQWRLVTRFISVSGGSMTNGEFATRARRGALPGQPGSPSTFLADYHGRLSTPHRWAFQLLIAVMASVALIALGLLWKTPVISQWIVERAPLRRALGATVVILLLGALWNAVKPDGRKFVLYLAVLAAVFAAARGLVGLVLWLPTWAQLLLGLIVVALALVVLWQLSGGHFFRWLLVVAAAATGIAILWVVLVTWGVRHDWQWLDWMLMVGLVVAVVVAFLFVLQQGVRLLLRYRLGQILGPDSSTPLGKINSDPNPDNKSGLVHVFSTADFGSGQPMYLTAGPGNPAGSHAVALHDMSKPANALHYYDASRISILDAAYAASALPGLVLPYSASLDEVSTGFVAPNIPVPDRGVVFGNPLAKHPPGNDFVLVDGGLNSTLGSRLDPVLGGWLDRRGTMEIIDALYPDATYPIENDLVRRVVVDAGQYLSDAGPVTKLATFPGLSAVMSLKRGIDIANLSLIASDRLVADRPGVDIWYLPTTGGNNAFTLRLTAAAIARLGLVPGSDPLHDVILDRGRLFWFNPVPPLRTIPPNLVGLARSIDRVVLLKQGADQISLSGGIAEHGYDALASGVASAFVEHEGLGVDEAELERCLFELDELLLADNPLMQMGRPLPLVVSHQGVRAPGVRGNTAAAFLEAIRSSFTMLEVDVMLTKNGLVALHPEHAGNGHPSASEARDLDFAEIAAMLPYPNQLVTLEQLLDPVTHAAELFPSEPLLVAMYWALALSTVVWNIEAKDTESAVAVAELLNDVPNGHIVRSKVIFSGGWLYRPIRAFRRIQPGIPTACHWLEAARWALGFQASRPALVQPPMEDPGAVWAKPFVLRLLRRGVRVARSQGAMVLWFQIDSHEEAVALRTVGPCHGFMSEGVDVVGWARAKYWP